MKHTKIILYVRWSDAAQTEGNSLERQVSEANAWIAREGLSDLPILRITDEGRSGYHGHHRSHGELGDFERQMIRGEHHGALFLVEKLDRLSREGHRKALDLIQSMTDHGVTVRTLDGDHFKAGEDAGLVQDITARLKTDLARAESKHKADRTRSNWRIRVESMAEGEAMSAVVCPPWLTVTDGKYALVDWKIEIINRMFSLADGGQGSSRITRIMNEQPKPSGWSNRKRKDLSKIWQRAEIKAILSNRALIGEYQPKTRINGKLVTNGEPIQGVFPVAVDPALFARVNANAASRKLGAGGGSSKRVNNLLTGLVKCRECGGSVHYRAHYLYCMAAYSGAAGVCTNRAGIRYRGRTGEGLEKVLLRAIGHLALDDELWSNGDEVSRINTLLVTREREYELATRKAENLWRAAAEQGSDMAARLAREAEKAANDLTVTLTGLRAQLEGAKGRVNEAEHLRRVSEILAQINQVDVRLKVAQALRTIVDRITHDGEGVTVSLKAGLATLRIVGDTVTQMDTLEALANGVMTLPRRGGQPDNPVREDVLRRVSKV